MNQAKQAIIVFTCDPSADHTGSRLLPYLNEQECKGLHEAFLKDIAATISDSLADILIAYETLDGEVLPEDAKLREIFPDAIFYPQTGETLGESLYKALYEGFNWGYSRCLLIDTNVPYAKNEDFNRAFDILTRRDYVIGPTEEGRFWLFGAKADPDEKPLQSILSLDQYEADSLVDDMIRMIPSWKTYELLEEKYDIDNIGDLLLHRDVAEGATAEYLRDTHVLSFIIPTYNEGESLERFLRELEKIGNQAEVIFVDGNSEDGTRERLAEACRSHRTYRLVRSITNRATQWNAGAEAANGDVLVFLHTEAVLSTLMIPEILRVLHTASAGYFPISYQSGGLQLWWARFLTNRRARKGHIAGEQGLFITRNCFYDSGMYPEVSYLEDLQFAKELRKCGVSTVAASIPLVLSGSKYSRDPSLQASDARMLNRLRKRYINGENPASLEAEFEVLRSRWYPAALPSPEESPDIEMK